MIRTARLLRTMAAEVRSRTVGADHLARKYPQEMDKLIEFRDFDEHGENVHDYHYRGLDGAKYQKVEISGTGAIKLASNPADEFNGDAVIDKCFAGWLKKGPRSEYWDILRQHKCGEMTEADAKAAIKTRWALAGPLGTEFHRQVELLLNRHEEDWATTADYDPMDEQEELTEGILTEFKQFRDWGRSAWVRERGLRPYRTELSIVWRREDDDVAVCAGQIDGLMREKSKETGEWLYSIFDWKRVKPKYMLTEYEKAFNDAKFIMFPHIPETHYHKYSMQASLYAEMLQQTTGIDVASRLYVVRVYKELGEAQLVKLRNYRAEAAYLLEFLETRGTDRELPPWGVPY